MERRIAKLKRAEHHRILALPPREWIRRGYFPLDSLPPDERDELLSVLEQAFDGRGHLDYRRLTPAQRERGVELLLKIRALEGPTS